MYSYSTLPSLVLDAIFSYLTFKERIKAKSVCRSWKDEIEYKDKRKDSLTFYFRFHPLNTQWSWSNNRGLIGVENSFEIKSLEFLRLPFTLNYFKNLKKINISNRLTFYTGPDRTQKPRNFINLFEQCEELEIYGFAFEGTTIFKLNRLRVLVFKTMYCESMKLHCPNLEVFICWSQVDKIEYKYPNKLNYIECYHYCLEFKLSAQFTNLQTLNFFNLTRPIRSDLLGYMPNLKRLILFSSVGKPDLDKLERQKQLYKMNQLEILSSGFKDALVKQPISQGMFFLNPSCVKAIFDNYPKLVEPIIWEILVDYNSLFDQFKILPNDFFVKLPLIRNVSIHEIDNYQHLTAFLKHCSMLECLSITTAKIQKPEFLDTLFLHHPSLNSLIFREQSIEYASFDLTFMLNLKLLHVRVLAPVLSIDFLRKIFKFNRYLIIFNYKQQNFGSKGFDLKIFKHDGCFEIKCNMGIKNKFRTIEDAIQFLRRNDLINRIIK